MKIIITKNYEEASQKAAEIILEIVKNKPNAILGLATGSTPLKTYEIMRKDHAQNGTSWKQIKTYNLDEYYGLDQDHPQSYYYFMWKNLFGELDIAKENVHVPSGKGSIDEVCAGYSQMLSENPRDLQLLGIGSNGHIAFNEPGTPFDSTTHYIELQESTIQDNAKLFFNGDIDAVPKGAITMGIKEIMEAKKIIVIATGQRKIAAVHKMLSGKITTDCPATILNKHQDVVLIIDEVVAEGLER
ncbi:MAG: glucosamine-6-phosphate deaminase [bacterium]